jgi:cyclic pyranopterin phosphate synthase
VSDRQNVQRDGLVDGYLRRVSYLRLSVTDRCNLRCAYCMPAGSGTCTPRHEHLTFAELVTLARTAVGLGIRKIRVTGGEPLLRRDIVPLLRNLGGLPGLERLMLTTNGARLAPLAHDLRAAGVHGVNVSLDSLDAGSYERITRGGRLADCLAGIDAALAAGLGTKLNVVVMRGLNDAEVPAFVELARRRDLTVRFIEYMPTRGRDADPALTVPTDDLLTAIGDIYDLQPLKPQKNLAHAGPARIYELPGGRGRIGFISAVTCKFCLDCNRIRVTAAGLARGCLFHEHGIDLKPLLARGDLAGLERALLQTVADKPQEHCLDRRDDGQEFAMFQLGG